MCHTATSTLVHVRTGVKGHHHLSLLFVAVANSTISHSIHAHAKRPPAKQPHTHTHTLFTFSRGRPIAFYGGVHTLFANSQQNHRRNCHTIPPSRPACVSDSVAPCALAIASTEHATPVLAIVAGCTTREGHRDTHTHVRNVCTHLRTFCGRGTYVSHVRYDKGIFSERALRTLKR